MESDAQNRISQGAGGSVLNDGNAYPIIVHVLVDVVLWMVLVVLIGIVFYGGSFQYQRSLIEFPIDLVKSLGGSIGVRILTLQLVLEIMVLFFIRIREKPILWENILVMSLISIIPGAMIAGVVVFDPSAVLHVLFGTPCIPQCGFLEDFPPVGLIIIISNLLAYFFLKKYVIPRR